MSLRGGLIFFPDEPLDLLPGGHAVLLSEHPLDGLDLRHRGLELRDTLLVLRPQGTGFAFLFRRPVEGTVAENVLRHGCGGLNINACRVGTNPGYHYNADRNGTTFHGDQGDRHRQTAEKRGQETIRSTQGRWPSNLVLVHHAECREVGTRKVHTSDPTRADGTVHGGPRVLFRFGQGVTSGGYASPDGFETIPAYECHETCPVRALDEQSGTTTSTGGEPQSGEVNRHGIFGARQRERTGQGVGKGDTGGASRFFPQFQDERELHEWLRLLIGAG